MKRALAATAAWLAFAGASKAADLSRRYDPPPRAPIYASGYNWTGFYLGINGGGGWGQSTWDGVHTFDVSGALIGGTAGYSWQFGPAVIGVEGDLDWSGIKGTTTILCGLGCETRNSWLGTVRGRLGYAFDRVLPFVTAGLAVGDISATTPLLPGGSVTTAGWTVGAGLEYAVVSNVTIKGEYLYVNLGDFNCGLNCGLVPTGNVSFYANILRAGLNVRF